MSAKEIMTYASRYGGSRSFMDSIYDFFNRCDSPNPQKPPTKKSRSNKKSKPPSTKKSTKSKTRSNK